MQIKTQGIVLHTLRYNDSNLIVDIYTQSLGSLTFMVRVSSSRKSTLKNVLLAPLTLLELDFDYRETQKFQRLSDVRLWQAYHSLPYHPVKMTIALFLGEFLYYALRNERNDDALFAYLYRSLLWLDHRERMFANFPATFLIRLSMFLGISPDTEEAQKMVRYNEQSLVPLILRMDFASMHLFRFSAAQRIRLMQVLNDYYRQHVPGFPELKSMAILREVLA